DSGFRTRHFAVSRNDGFLFRLHRPHSTGSRRDQAVARELIGALVHGMTGVALHPVPAHLVMAERGIEPLPQIDILHRLLVGGAPAVLLPAVDPASNAAAHIFA